jgi:hypothetical protein
MSLTYPPQLLWVVGEQHVDAWTNAADYLHANAHITAPLGHRPNRDQPCDACWRAAAYAVKGVLLAGYQKTPATMEA